ncbi:hypothetical protein PPYR_12613 [Photinus pyralis]|uniref:Uncharacterized protein n=1 Tax=Photinus pyralis TaxID=7054 RepID=A0A1Y1K6B7_PHOPY|nr:uncharacterized protein LOC116177877 [Photinus pyralis]KAB0792993.1 hypothetical protein PPYR_12613 [Photinus pyralis]
MSPVRAAIVIVLISASATLGQIISRAWEVEGYYWRDFNGTVPSDAYAGGSDATGKPIYIGQVFDKYLIPAKIYANDNKAYYEHGKSEYKATEHVKILCTQHPEQFEWIKTDNDALPLLTNKNLLIGGYEPGSTTYIGRVRYNGEVSIGKALVHFFFIHSGLHITSNGSGKRFTEFEVLAFDPSSPKIGLPFRLD